MPGRSEMVRTQLVDRGISDENVLRAMESVPREAFVEASDTARAFEDRALPIAAGQTISQPYVVALMAAALQLSFEARVLDVGTGSGYAAAVLSRVAARVVSVERIEALANSAARRLERLGYDNVEVHVADGSLGWPADQPYDGIHVAAGGPAVPDALVDQLAPGGRLVMPVGPEGSQDLVVVTADGLARSLGPVAFVPLVGAAGWPSASGSEDDDQPESDGRDHGS